MTQIIEALLELPLTPSEMIDVTRKVTSVQEDTGDELTTDETVCSIKAIFMPPETMNKNDGAILQQLMTGNKTKEVFMIYCFSPDIKEGDIVYRRENGYYYEVKIVAFYGSKINIVPISCTKLYVVRIENKKSLSGNIL